MAPQFWEPVAVPANDGPVLELVDMWAAAIPAKLGGPLMKELGRAAPMGPLVHVKRVRKRQDGGGSNGSSSEGSKGPAGQLEILLCRRDWREHLGEEALAENGQEAAPEQQQVAAQAAASSMDSGADLPPAVAAVVRQHGLQPFLAQVSASAVRACLQCMHELSACHADSTC